MSDDRPSIAHAARCGRRAALVLRAAWNGTAEWWCPSCGRSCPANEIKETE